MEKEEIWKPIPGYEGIYEVSSLGRVKSLRRVEHSKLRGFYICKERILTPVSNGRGYLGLMLTKNGVHRHHYIHRLVAVSFIPNPNNFPQINHKDEHKTNNDVTNLEWCTCIYNNRYGSAKERASKSCGKAVGKYSLSGELISIYPSLTEAAKQNGFKLSPISNCFVGRNKTSYGFIWKPITRIFNQS